MERQQVVARIQQPMTRLWCHRQKVLPNGWKLSMGFSTRWMCEVESVDLGDQPPLRFRLLLWRLDAFLWNHLSSQCLLNLFCMMMARFLRKCGGHIMQMPHVCHCFVVQYLDLPICFSSGLRRWAIISWNRNGVSQQGQGSDRLYYPPYISKSHFRQEKKEILLILSLVLFLSVILDLTWRNRKRKDCNAEYEVIHLEYHESWMHNSDLHQLWSLEVLRMETI